MALPTSDTLADRSATSRTTLAHWVMSPAVERFTTVLILLNAVTLGLQTYPDLLTRWQLSLGIPVEDWLDAFDWFVLAAFTAEILLRALAQGRRFFSEPWNLFDAVVVGVSLMGQSPFFSVLRVLRILRVLRLLARVKSLRLISSVIWQSLSGCLSISAIMFLVLFIFAIIGNELYGASHPQLFGNLHLAMHSLFRVAAIYAYDDILSQLVQTHPNAYLFIIPYFVLMSYVVINFFSAIVVYYLYEISMEELKSGERAARSEDGQEPATPTEGPHGPILAELLEEVKAMRRELEALKRAGS